MGRFARRLQQGISLTPINNSPTTLEDLIVSAPPTGTSPAPSGPMAGTPGEFDYSTLATNEVWDHFDGTTLDSRLWQRDDINQGGTQIYRDSNTYLDGSGNAVMECTREGGTIYSGKFTSRQKFAMNYGWFAARIKMPKSMNGVGGAWFPAFWLLLVDYNNSPNYAEIDMMEQFGDSSSYSTHIYFNDGDNEIESSKNVPASQDGDASEDYHTYWMMRESDRIRVGVDDLQVIAAARRKVVQAPAVGLLLVDGVDRQPAAQQRTLEIGLGGQAVAAAGLVQPGGGDAAVGPAHDPGTLAGAVVDIAEGQDRPVEGVDAVLARALEAHGRGGAAVLLERTGHGEQGRALGVGAQHDISHDVLALHVDPRRAADNDLDAVDLAGLDAAQGVFQ